MKVRLLLAACLLATAPALAETGRLPDKFLKFEAASIGIQGEGAVQTQRGYNSWVAMPMRLADVTLAWRRLRVGATALDDDAGYGHNGNIMVLPVHVGVTLASRTRRVWKVYSTSPDVYLEARGGLLDKSLAVNPELRVALGSNWDFVVAGLRLEAGVVCYRLVYEVGRPESTVYATLQARLLTFGVGF